MGKTAKEQKEAVQQNGQDQKVDNLQSVIHSMGVPITTENEDVLKSVGSNMAIWLLACMSDPKTVRDFKIGSKLLHTGDPQVKRKIMTAIFGPIGLGWGVEKEDFNFRGEGYHEHVHYTARLWVRIPDTPHFKALSDMAMNSKTISFSISANAFLYTKARDYWRRNDHYSKTVRTDALTKGMSFLGIGSDLFEGKFDDDAYIQEANDMFTLIPDTAYKGTGAGSGQKNTPSNNGSQVEENIFKMNEMDKKAAIGYFTRGYDMEYVLQVIEGAGFTVKDDKKKELEDFYKKFLEEKRLAENQLNQNG